MILGPEFFARPTLEVAPDLLGATLFVEQDGIRCSGKIVEVEAYLGQEDAASHAAAGPTPRSQVMFGPPGRSYVYFIYGMYHCLNFVTEKEGTAGAVLVRALQPVSGLEIMIERRGGVPLKSLCDGPGKLCQALGVDRQWNDLALDGKGPRAIFLEAPETPVSFRQTPRVGISKAQELPYRFLLESFPQ